MRYRTTPARKRHRIAELEQKQEEGPGRAFVIEERELKAKAVLRRSWVIALCALGLMCNPAGAQVGAIGVVLAGKKVSEIINELELTGSSLIAQAGATGNGLISHAGNEANVLAKNVSFEFRDRLDQTFDRLDNDERKMLSEVEQTRQALAAVADKAYDAKDTLTVDLNRLLDGFPFLSKGFFVQNIRGVALFPAESDFKIKVTASTLGIDENVKTTIAVSVDGKELSEVAVDQSLQRNQAVITIPNAVLAPRFKDRDLALVKAVLTFKVQRKKGVGPFKWFNEEGPFSVPLTLALYPRVAATVSIMAMQPKYEWVAAGTLSDSMQTPDRHCHHCHKDTTGPNHLEISVPGGNEPVVDYKRFVGTPTLACIEGDGVCGFSRGQRTDIINNGTKATADWLTNSHPTVWRLTASVEKYAMTGETPFAGAPQEAAFGSVLYFDFPKASTVKKLRVRTFTKNDYEVLVGAADPQQILEPKGTEASAPPNLTRAVYQVNRPSGNLN